MSPVTLFYFPGACSLVPHILLEEAAARYERHALDYVAGEHRSPEYLAISPLGRVPALLTERGPLVENPAIISFIAQSYPDAALAPLHDAYAFARMQSFNLFISSNIHAAYRQLVFPDTFADGEIAAQALRAKVPELADRYYAIIEKELSDDREFVHGDRFTTSDVYLYVYASYMRLGERGDPSKLPFISAHRDRIGRRPAVRRILEVEGLTERFGA